MRSSRSLDRETIPPVAATNSALSETPFFFAATSSFLRRRLTQPDLEADNRRLLACCHAPVSLPVPVLYSTLA